MPLRKNKGRWTIKGAKHKRNQKKGTFHKSKFPYFHYKPTRSRYLFKKSLSSLPKLFLSVTPTYDPIIGIANYQQGAIEEMIM